MSTSDLNKLFGLSMDLLWALATAAPEVVDPDFSMKLQEHTFSAMESITPEARAVLMQLLESRAGQPGASGDFYRALREQLSRSH